jgi:hypothetical protein
MSLRARVHIWAVAVLLGGYGLWKIVDAVETGVWPSGLGAAIPLAAAAAAATSRRWSRFLIYAFAVLLIGEWLWVVGYGIRSGFLGPYLRNMPPLKAVLVFVPACVMFLLTGYCVYVAYKYIGGDVGTSNNRWRGP